jgi:GTPase SAR1 family protein
MVAAAFFQKTATTKSGRAINIMLWDRSGQDYFHFLAPIYYKEGHVGLLVCSVVDQPSFDRMVQSRNELVSSRGGDIRLVIAANKIDLKDGSQKGVHVQSRTGGTPASRISI